MQRLQQTCRLLPFLRRNGISNFAIPHANSAVTVPLAKAKYVHVLRGIMGEKLGGVGTCPSHHHHHHHQHHGHISARTVCCAICYPVYIIINPRCYYANEIWVTNTYLDDRGIYLQGFDSAPHHHNALSCIIARGIARGPIPTNKTSRTLTTAYCRGILPPKGVRSTWLMYYPARCTNHGDGRYN